MQLCKRFTAIEWKQSEAEVASHGLGNQTVCSWCWNLNDSTASSLASVVPAQHGAPHVKERGKGRTESGKRCRTGEFGKKNVAFRFFFLDQMFAANSNFFFKKVSVNGSACSFYYPVYWMLVYTQPGPRGGQRMSHCWDFSLF